MGLSHAGALPSEEGEVEAALGAVAEAVDVVGVGDPDDRGPEEPRRSGLEPAGRRASGRRSPASPAAAMPTRAATRATYRLATSVTISTMKLTTTASGRMTSIVPASVTTPRPPPRSRNIDRHEPISAAVAVTTSIVASPPVASRARSTGSSPFSRSPTTTSAAPRGPSARRAFVVPVRPEPIVRGSGPPIPARPGRRSAPDRRRSRPRRR